VRRDALGRAGERPPVAAEVLEENRFLAARDGMDASFVDPAAGCRVPVAERLSETLHSCAPHAERLRCEVELASVRALAEHPGARRQRALADRPEGLPGVLRAMHGDFVSALAEPAALA
jgi:glutamate---cysteine ligase / carboxylate-amine ligase